MQQVAWIRQGQVFGCRIGGSGSRDSPRTDLEVLGPCATLPA
ncbi:MAG: hypothetical protein R3E68_05305 [Burkholderiaceae bacterium]